MFQHYQKMSLLLTNFMEPFPEPKVGFKLMVANRSFE